MATKNPFPSVAQSNDSDGTVLIAGGGDFSGTILAAAEVFNPTNATLLKDGSVLVTGGVGQGSIILTAAEVYH